LTYNYSHLSNSLQILQEIADGSHPFCERLAQAELPMIMVGTDTLSRTDG